MRTATELLYHAAGCPDVPDLAGERPVEPCGLCGGTTHRQGRPLRDIGKGKGKVEGWLKPTFTAYPQMAHYHDRAWICVACLFSMREWIVLEGRENQKMRTYSHLVEGTNWTLATKSPEGRRAMRAFISSPHEQEWAATLAVSGQKHLCFLTRSNAPNDRLDMPVFLQVETDCLSVRPVDIERVLKLYEEVYIGFSKTEIDSGAYSPRRISLFGAARLRGIEKYLCQERGSLLFGLCSFLALREEIAPNDITPEEYYADANNGSAGDDPRDLSQSTAGSNPGSPSPAPCSGGEPDHPLGSDASGDAVPVSANLKRAGVARARDAASTDQQPQQLDLFSR